MRDPLPERVKDVFNQVMGLAPGQRVAFLDSKCGADVALRRRVERLLVSAEGGGPFLDAPTLASVSPDSAHEAVQLLPGATLGARYRILNLAGIGGMGEVYRAEDLHLGQAIALKLLPAELAEDEAQLSRLLDEARIARQVSHPNVCRVYDIGQAEGRQFLSMEWIQGQDLASMLRTGGKLSPDTAVSIARQVCAGLAAAHDCNVVHRDLKPANVMVDDRGVARITDFGLAAIVAVGRGDLAREGTPHYMSPEQLAGEEVSFPSDIYSLGLVLYELFTGKKCHEGRTLAELMDQERETPSRPSSLAPEIDPAVEKLIIRCLERDPNRRPPSARVLADALPGGGPSGEALIAAQRRADRIAAFRAEARELRRIGLLQIGEEDLKAVDTHHEQTLRDLVQRFDVDVSERGKQLSLGMRAVSVVGAVALAASVYYFFYRTWGVLSTPMQIGILGSASVAALFLTDLIARRERSGHFTLMSGLVTFACLIINTSILESTFNVARTAWPLLSWGGLAMILAYAYRLRSLLLVGVVLLNVFVAAGLLHWNGGDWTRYLTRPEGFFPGGLVLLALSLTIHQSRFSAFRRVYSITAVFFLIAPTLPLGTSGSLSYLALEKQTIEIGYQALGFAISGTAIWLGITRRWRGAVYTATFFFVLLLYVEFVNWWWAWMPKYLFFLIIALTSIIVMVGLKRLRATLTAGSLEAGR